MVNKLLSLFLFLMGLTSLPTAVTGEESDFDPSRLVWPLGESTCTGPWSYQAFNSCTRSVKGKVSSNRYEQKVSTCAHWGFGEEYVGIQSETIKANNRGKGRACFFHSSDLSKRNRNHPDTPRTYSYDSHTDKFLYSEGCTSGPFGRCTSQYEVYCKLKVVKPKIGTDASYCGYEDDLAKPIMIDGVISRTVIDRDCGMSAKLSSRGLALGNFIDPTIHDEGSPQCTTGDGIDPANGSEEATKKLKLVSSALVAASRDISLCDYAEHLIALLDQLLPYIETNYPEVRVTLSKRIRDRAQGLCE